MNLFVFFVLYFGMKDIFTWTIGKGFRKESSLSFWNNYESKQLLSSGLAFLSVSSEYIMANFSIYMVDLIYLPLLLEVFKYVFYEKISINEFYLCSIYVGLSTAAKATNIIFSIPLLFVILAKNGRNLTIKQISTILSLAVLPLIIYVSFNLINTGNPIYFYYNKIFKSPYFPLENFKDTCWGPKNLLETVFYPIVIFDQNRVSELQLYSGRLSISFVFSVLIFIVTVINKKLRREFWFISVFLLMNYLWIISTGYVRYALFLELISIEIILFLLIRLSRIYSGSFIKAVLGLFLILISYQSVSAHKIILIDNLDWSVRPGIFDFIKNGNVRGFVKLYLENSRSILIDRYPYLNENDQRYVAQIDSWYVSNVTSGFTTILNKNIPFITGEDYYLNEKLKDIKRKYIEKQKSISTVADITTLQFAITSMNNGGLTISGIRFIYPNFLMSKQPLIVFQLKNEPSINSFVTLNKTSSYSINIENINNNSTFDAFFFQNPLYNNSDEIILKATLGEKIYYWNVSKKDVIRIHIEISGKYNTKAIVFEILDSKKESPGYGILLNPQFKTK